MKKSSRHNRKELTRNKKDTNLAYMALFMWIKTNNFKLVSEHTGVSEAVLRVWKSRDYPKNWENEKEQFLLTLKTKYENEFLLKDGAMLEKKIEDLSIIDTSAFNAFKKMCVMFFRKVGSEDHELVTIKEMKIYFDILDKLYNVMQRIFNKRELGPIGYIEISDVAKIVGFIVRDISIRVNAIPDLDIEAKNNILDDIYRYSALQFESIKKRSDIIILTEEEARELKLSQAKNINLLEERHAPPPVTQEDDEEFLSSLARRKRIR